MPIAAERTPRRATRENSFHGAFSPREDRSANQKLGKRGRLAAFVARRLTFILEKRAANNNARGALHRAKSMHCGLNRSSLNDSAAEKWRA
jgi:hypothetical protein